MFPDLNNVIKHTILLNNSDLIFRNDNDNDNDKLKNNIIYKISIFIIDNTPYLKNIEDGSGKLGDLLSKLIKTNLESLILNYELALNYIDMFIINRHFLSDSNDEMYTGILRIKLVEEDYVDPIYVNYMEHLMNIYNTKKNGKITDYKRLLLVEYIYDNANFGTYTISSRGNSRFLSTPDKDNVRTDSVEFGNWGDYIRNYIDIYVNDQKFFTSTGNEQNNRNTIIKTLFSLLHIYYDTELNDIEKISELSEHTLNKGSAWKKYFDSVDFESFFNNMLHHTNLKIEQSNFVKLKDII
jgi:hypothetical protein